MRELSSNTAAGFLGDAQRFEPVFSIPSDEDTHLNFSSVLSLMAIKKPESSSVILISQSP